VYLNSSRIPVEATQLVVSHKLHTVPFVCKDGVKT